MSAITLFAVLSSLPADAPAQIVDRDHFTVMTVGHLHTENDSYYKHYAPPSSWASAWHPAHWDLHMTRKDAVGRSWSACGSSFVMDDFGFLVGVAS